MSDLSVLIELRMSAIYGTKCNDTKTIIVKLLFKFCFQRLCHLLKMAPKVNNHSKFTKEQEMFAFGTVSRWHAMATEEQDMFTFWTIDGVHHQFNKYW
jgi:hypothetical protein